MKKKWPQKNDKEETQKGRDSIKDEKDWIPEEETKRHFKLKRQYKAQNLIWERALRVCETFESVGS